MNELSYYLDTCPDFIKNNFSFEKFNTFDKILVQNEKSDFVYIIIKRKLKIIFVIITTKQDEYGI